MSLKEQIPSSVRYRIGRGVAWAAIQVSAARIRKRRRPKSPKELSAPPTPAATRRFEVHTFVTDDEQYEAMAQTFEAAGFRPPVATLVKLADHRHSGDTEPFATITQLGERRTSSYRILCHQDVRLDQGAGADDLLRALRHLTDRDPYWVVAGSVGGTRDLQLVRRLVDRNGGSSNHPLPSQVVSLDEAFLVFNPNRQARCSSGLSGFHFYGPDVCLNAIAEGGTAYVIDFPFSHLSGGTIPDEYYEARTRFLDVWNRRHTFLYLRTGIEVVFISRSAVLRRLFGSPRVMRLIWDVIKRR